MGVKINSHEYLIRGDRSMNMPVAFMKLVFLWSLIFEMSSGKSTNVGLRIAHVQQGGFKKHSSPGYAETYKR